MPRGVKGSGKIKNVKSIDERIAENEAAIEALQSKLTEAKAKRKELRQQKEFFDFEEIQRLIKKSKLTPDELKELLTNKE